MSAWTDFFNGSPEERECIGNEVLARATERQQVIISPAPIQDGYWDDEFERQWHYEVKGG